MTLTFDLEDHETVAEARDELDQMLAALSALPGDLPIEELLETLADTQRAELDIDEPEDN